MDSTNEENSSEKAHVSLHPGSTGALEYDNSKPIAMS
jgi:hypothetical protein